MIEKAARFNARTAICLYACRDMLLCMRTTLDINDALLLQAKSRAARSRQTLTALVEAALRRHLEADRARPAKVPEIPIFHGGGEMPGVDLTNSRALLDILEDGKPRR
jgi:hypothetical protein